MHVEGTVDDFGLGEIGGEFREREGGWRGGFKGTSFERKRSRLKSRFHALWGKGWAW